MEARHNVIGGISLITSTQVDPNKRKDESEDGPVNLDKTAVKSLRICLFCN